MSVLESMQMGLIPIVTNVGELQNYCIDNKNSIIFKDIESTKDKIIKLLTMSKLPSHIKAKIKSSSLPFWQLRLEL